MRSHPSIRCRPAKSKIKLCPAFKLLRQTLAVSMYEDGDLKVEDILAKVGFLSFWAVTRLAKKSGVKMRGRGSGRFTKGDTCSP